MKKYLLLMFLVPCILSFTIHKYYLSVSDIVYNKEAQSIQIITRLFYDDLEDVLNERYDVMLELTKKSEQESINLYLRKYLNSKVNLKVNGKLRTAEFIGKEYEDDFVVCYLEIPEVNDLEQIEIENTLLMDLFPDQKNMVHTTILNKKKSFLLTRERTKAMLNFSE